MMLWRRATLLAVLMLCVLTVGVQAQVRTPSSLGTLTGSNIRSGSSSSNSGTGSSSTNNPFGNNDSTFRDTNEVKGLVYHKETPDSVLQKQVFMFHYEPLSTKINSVWNPTLDPTGVQHADRLDAINGNYYLGKGTVGQPHIALFPTLAAGLEHRLQPDPNIGYAKRRDNIWLFQTMTPYTLLSYNSSLDKDYVVRIGHTQNIRPGWNIAFDYNLICPEGVYTSSGDKNHYLDATTNYFSPDSRIQAAFGVIWQSFNIDENGGISDDRYLTDRLQSNRAGIPVNIYNSGTVHRERAAFGKVSYNLVQQVTRYRHRDSLAVRTVGDTMTIVDTILVTDTILAAKPHVLNAGIIGIEACYDHRKRLFVDSTLWTHRSMTVYWTNDAYPDHRWRNPVKLTLGIKPQYVKAIIDGTGKMELTSLLDPFVKTAIAVGRSTLRAEAILGGNFGTLPDYHYGGSLDLPFDSAGSTTLHLMAVAERQYPDVRILYDAKTAQGLDLRPQKKESFVLNLESGRWLDATVRATHLSHNVWYDTTMAVCVGSTPLWLYQASFTMHLKFGWLHLDMQQLLQHTTDSIQLPLPLWASKNSLYADLRLFHRALRLQTGVDVRYHTAFHSPAYDYQTGLFYHQDEVQVGNYLWGDLFVNIQVKRASIYVKAGHLNALWEMNPNYFLLPHYPGRKFGLYWGITWNFFD